MRTVFWPIVLHYYITLDVTMAFAARGTYSSRAYCKLTFGPFEQQLRDRQTSASTRCPWTDTVTDREPRVTREGYRCIKHHRNQLTGRLYTQGVHVRYGFM